MKKPAISILIPHIREPRCDDALKICLECIMDNTTVDYEVMIKAIAGPQGTYGCYNDMAERAAAEWLLIINTDMFLAPGWAEPMLKAAKPDTIVAGVLVESGAVCVSFENINRNFGMLPETFDREKFEAWVREVEPALAGHGHHAPVLFNRMEFLDFGGYDTSLGEYPLAPLDQILWSKWKASGRKLKRVRGSYCYHLQQWSDPKERAKKSRIKRKKMRKVKRRDYDHAIGS